MFGRIQRWIAGGLIIVVVLVSATYLSDMNRAYARVAGRAQSYLRPMATSNTPKAAPVLPSWWSTAVAAAMIRGN